MLVSKEERIKRYEEAAKDSKRFNYQVACMEIRTDLIQTREKLTVLYLQTGNEALFPLISQLHKAIEEAKDL